MYLRAMENQEKQGLYRYGFCGSKEEQNVFVKYLNATLDTNSRVKGLGNLTSCLIENEIFENDKNKIIPSTLRSREGHCIAFHFQQVRNKWVLTCIRECRTERSEFQMYELFKCGTETEQREFLMELNSLSNNKFDSIHRIGEHIVSKEDRERNKFRVVETDLIDHDGNEIYIWGRYSSGIKSYKDIACGSIYDLGKYIRIYTKFSHVGNLIFDNEHFYASFMDELKKRALPEPWSLSDEKVKDSILCSYLQFTLVKLMRDDEGVVDTQKKIQFGQNEYKKPVVAFNTNLLDRHSMDIFVGGEMFGCGKRIFIKNPHVFAERQLKGYGIDPNLLKPAKYFDNLQDILYHSDWRIDTDFYKLEHVLTRVEYRIGVKLNASELTTAINFAQRISQRNYKFIVPMYHPEQDRVQFLMPLYFKGEYKDSPDAALILTPDEKTEYYTPETILTLQEAYKDARLIVRPDNAWLDPGKIKVTVPNDDSSV